MRNPFRRRKPVIVDPILWPFLEATPEQQAQILERIAYVSAHTSLSAQEVAQCFRTLSEAIQEESA